MTFLQHEGSAQNAASSKTRRDNTNLVLTKITLLIAKETSLWFETGLLSWSSGAGHFASSRNTDENFRARIQKQF